MLRCWLNPSVAPGFEQQTVIGWERWRPLFVCVTPLVAIFMIVVVAMSAGFTMRGVAPAEISTRQSYAAVVPYVLFGLLMLAAVMAVPGLATWLPG